jgi:hypothetical protein
MGSVINFHLRQQKNKMPALPNIGGYGQTTDVTATVNVKNIDVVNCDADLVSTAVLVINGNTVDIPGIESDILTAEGNITTLQGQMTTQQTKTQYQTAAANLTTFTGDATVTGLLTPTVTQGKFGFYTKNTSTVFTNPVTSYDLAYTTLLYSTGNVPLTNVSGVFTSTAAHPITCMCTVLLTWPANAVGYRTMQVNTSNTAGNVPQNITFGGPLDVPNYASNQYVQEWHFTVVLGVGGSFKVQGSHQSGGSLTSIAHNTTNPFCIQIVVL